MNYTDEQLKRALARMLSEQLVWHGNRKALVWRASTNGIDVRDTELLHLCWIVEQSISYSEKIDYLSSFNCGPHFGPAIHYMISEWQQRVIALAKVKGVEL